MPEIRSGGFSHSDIHASTVTCTSTRLFAACHVLLRLREPRHPPYALSFRYSPILSYLSGNILQLSSSLRLLMICFLAFACGSLLRVRIACFNMSYIASPLRRPPGRSLMDSILAEIVENNGFEPLTLCLQSRCSSQLS